jgi:hypothetical protein
VALQDSVIPPSEVKCQRFRVDSGRSELPEPPHSATWMLDALEADASLRALVLTGAGEGVFVAHHEVGELADGIELALLHRAFPEASFRTMPSKDAACARGSPARHGSGRANSGGGRRAD